MYDNYIVELSTFLCVSVVVVRRGSVLASVEADCKGTQCPTVIINPFVGATK